MPGGTAPPGPSAGREGQTNSEGMKVVKLLDQASEDGPRDSLREQVGDHHDAGEVFDGVEAVLPGREAISASGHAMEAHA